MIDLRSDTVTRPTSAMRAAMMAAEVGDDVFGEDPTVNALEERIARLFGHEAGMFCPSGTMANQIAVNIHTRPGDEVICDEGAHIYRYEGGGTMVNSGCSVKFVPSDRGRFTAERVQEAINDDQQWLTRTRLVNFENTCNRGGGAVWDIAEVDRIKAICKTNGLALHMDGARIFNAMAATGESPADWGARCDTISICLSKGLGAPVGSVLIGSKELMRQARRVRKRLGGGMRQAGLLAAACHYALDHHVDRLKDDHRRAALLEAKLLTLPYVSSVMPVRTNIVIFTLANKQAAEPFLAKLNHRGVRAVAFGPSMVRMVLHLDVDDKDISHVITQLTDLQ
ncbi:MAG: aminotransferase class V-fold PLP-dependent enzyme [Flavobacteriales bacterium]|jgi:threonine aldolase|nr:aminotransferase class V-fold PLP-dependent enzyme [Flavobacteriales bacterium]MBK7103639.1 aminotransferase class V-fold PLP-dependent enzyme [Flavobacteriales bacterium]MBK7618570.1 aminotransferase class V-fold PLP-dependent enzyme [Flavobacteriales bacterium]MBK8532648.1 aminotransferase class V-fold PLP-dependent enzyme [Flavobacteriales bacterium]MBK8709465.1 aminotransferase class V-fold PLP-dependent enzyme [Flavobacteriales bacterium]